jgi:hypothetical protein
MHIKKNISVMQLLNNSQQCFGLQEQILDAKEILAFARPTGFCVMKRSEFSKISSCTAQATIKKIWNSGRKTEN